VIEPDARLGQCIGGNPTRQPYLDVRRESHLGQHLAAAAAHCMGESKLAAALTELAEAAERSWIARNVHAEAR
jgi:hypothetical protein